MATCRSGSGSGCGSGSSSGTLCRAYSGGKGEKAGIFQKRRASIANVQQRRQQQQQQLVYKGRLSAWSLEDSQVIYFPHHSHYRWQRWDRTKGQPNSFGLLVSAAATVSQNAQNVDLPPVLPKNKKKPAATPKKEMMRRRRSSRNSRRQGPLLEPVLRPPKNGLLVKGLIPVAHGVMEARAAVTKGVGLLLQEIPVVTCKCCLEVHVSRVGHKLQTCRGPKSNHRQSFHQWVKATIDDILVPVEAFHLEDRLAPPISHNQRFDADRISAVVELCIQAGVDVPEFPTRRYSEPFSTQARRRTEGDLRWIGGEFVQDLSTAVEQEQEQEQQEDKVDETVWKGKGLDEFSLDGSGPADNEILEDGEEREKEEDDHWDVEEDNDNDDEEEEEAALSARDDSTIFDADDDLQAVATKTFQAWEKMRAGVKKLKVKYRVLACGYCPEVHVGPKGHRARVCGAFKHQSRDGKHGWQSATVDELVPPQYVWHSRRDGNGNDTTLPFENALRPFYGQAPAVVEMCVQAGIPVPNSYKPLMRLDVAIPTLEELAKVI